MRDEIVKKLLEIEKEENIRILLAVESGSRAWGFPSPDSDYDVRFIYIRKVEDYLRLDPPRDVIELPINEVLDINGWDLSKTLQLLYKSNPALFEWFSSPIVYMETEFADSFRQIMNSYFSTKHALYHYISMAKNNNREFLSKDMVKLKKYFYVLRPILACRWILDKKTPPPMMFTELMDAELPAEYVPCVKSLLDMKMNAPEIGTIPRVKALNDYLDSSIEEMEMKISSLEDGRERNCDELNAMFLAELQK